MFQKQYNNIFLFCQIDVQMDIELSSASYKIKLTHADKRLFNKPKKNLIQLIDYVGSVDNSLNDTMNSIGSTENAEVHKINQTSAVISGMCICKLFYSLLLTV